MKFQHFLNIFIEILNKHVPIEQRHLRANQGRFMTQNLHKAITKRSRLRKKFLSDRIEMSRKEYKKKTTKLLPESLKKNQKRTFSRS